MSDEYVFTLPYPPSINSYYGITCNARIPHKFIKEKGRLYREAVIGIIKEKNLDIRANVPLSMTLILTPPDNRTRDIDNGLKCLLDSLTHANVLEDDKHIRKLEVSYVEKDNYEKPGSVLIMLKAL